jgi:hypothetical protein
MGKSVLRPQGRRISSACTLIVLSLAACITSDKGYVAEELPEWIRLIRKDHPRLFFNSDTWPAVRRRALGKERQWYLSIKARVDIRVDSARGSYTLTSSTIDTYDEFLDTLQAFYMHLQRCIGPGPTAALDTSRDRGEAIALLERTFCRKGGEQAAFALARDGIQGGMRSVLDALTEQFKAERQATYVQRVFKEAIAALDWDERVTFMRGAMKRLGPFLPSELKNEPPERFARSCEAIVHAYVQSLDKIGHPRVTRMIPSGWLRNHRKR